MNAASLIIGTKIRLTTNPGPSATSTGVFPRDLEISRISSFTPTGVLIPEITSTNFIRSAGLKKCIPITLCLIPVAISVIDNEEVFVPKIQESLQISSNCLNKSFLTSIFSRTASTIRSQSAKSLYSPAFKFPLTSSAFSAVIFSLETSLSNFLAILSIPPCAHSILMSHTVTSYPLEANAFAMPCPIVPAQITPTFFMIIISFSKFILRKEEYSFLINQLLTFFSCNNFVF